MKVNSRRRGGIRCRCRHLPMPRSRPTAIPFKSQWRELINSGVSALSYGGAKGENILFACKHYYIVMLLYAQDQCER